MPPLTTLFGITILCKVEHQLKALVPKSNTELGMVIPLMLALWSKALSPMAFTGNPKWLLGIITLVPPGPVYPVTLYPPPLTAKVKFPGDWLDRLDKLEDELDLLETDDKLDELLDEFTELDELLDEFLELLEELTEEEFELLDEFHEEELLADDADETELLEEELLDEFRELLELLDEFRDDRLDSDDLLELLELDELLDEFLEDELEEFNELDELDSSSLMWALNHQVVRFDESPIGTPFPIGPE